jgi:predicted metal-dependent peptidase
MERSRVYIATEFPWYSSMLSDCTISYSDKVPTACVRLNSYGNIELHVNKKFFYNLPENERVGLLMHEMLHIGMKHLVRGKDLDKKIANIAMDIAINQYIPKDLLPKGGLLPEQFKLPPGKAFEEYYIKLMQDAKAQKAQTLDDHSQWEQGMGDEGEGSMSSEMAEAAIDNMLKKAGQAAEGKQAGSTPKPVQKIMDAAQKERAKINWKMEIRRYIGRKYSRERETTRNKPNRRMGFMAPGIKYMDAPKIHVAIDESGSVSNEMVQRLMNEVEWILESVKDKVEVSFFDTQIAKTISMTQLKDKKTRYAHGGTDFECVIKKSNEMHADLTIILTDGGAGCPQKANRPVIWALLGGNSGEHLYGKKVQIS